MSGDGFELDAFHAHGFARIPGALDAAEVGAMRERLSTELSARGVELDDTTTWPVGTVSGMRSVRRGDARPRDSAPVADALGTVFGDVPHTSPTHWGQVLVAFPETRPCTVPRRGWHGDFPFWFSPDEVWGAVAFLFLADVDTRGGATFALEGSPELVRNAVAGRADLATAPPAAVIADVLAGVPAMARASDEELLTGFVASDGSRLRVVELTGRAGDVVMCHPWLLHCASVNVSSRPRLQRAARVQRRFDR